MFKKLDNIIYNFFNLAILGFWVYGACIYPDSPVSLFIFLIAAAVVMYILFSIVCKINDHFVDRDIQRYVDSGFDPRSVKRNYR